MTGVAPAGAPPGYRASAATGEHLRGPRPATLLAAQMVLTAALLLAAARELLMRLPPLYAGPLGMGQGLRVVGLCAGLGAGLLLARRVERTRLAVASLGAVSIASSVAPLSWALAFSEAERFSWLAPLLMASAGALLGLAAAAALAWLVPHARLLRVLLALLSPLSLAAAVFAFALSLGAATLLPVAHSGPAIGLTLGLLCLAGVGLERYLTRRVLPAWLRVGVPLLAVAASTAALVRAERVLPRTEARIYSGDVLVFSGGERQRLALVSHRSYFELYLDRTLKLSGVDAYRYAEVLVHPALAASQRRERVLLLGGGTGVVEREILRWPEVHSLTVVVTDRTLSELARRSPWLRAANAAVLDDPRVQVVEAEPIVWLGRERSLYDAIIADLDDPIGYRQSKHFTRHTFHSIAARLTPGGVGSVQAPSPLTFHAAYASVFSTLRAAGLQTAPYHAPLPTLGEGGFFLFGASSSGALAERASSGGAMLPAGLRFLTAAGMQALFHFSADLKPSLAPDAPANTLHDQPLVELYAREHESR